MISIFEIQGQGKTNLPMKIEASVSMNKKGALMVTFQGLPETWFSLEDGKLLFTIMNEDGSSMSVDLTSQRAPLEPNMLQCLQMHKGENATDEPMYFSDLVVPEIGQLMRSMIDMGGSSVQKYTFAYGGPLYFRSNPEVVLTHKQVVMGESNWEIRFIADDGWEYVYLGIGYTAEDLA